MRVGLGITTYNRPELLEKCLRQINRHTFMDDVTIYVAKDTDEDRRGVAYRKNECLRALKDCDHIILLDDDCYPIKDGWIEFLISEQKRTGENHFLFLHKTHNKIKTINGLDYYADCGGVCMYLTKKCLDVCGGFNEQYDTWGMEHCGYTIRINKSGLNSYKYICPTGLYQYLKSLDYENSVESTINNFQKNLLYNKNIHIFVREINSNKLYYPYENL